MFRFPLVTATALLIAAGCSHAPKSEVAAAAIAASAGADVESYRIGIEDSLQVMVWRNPELSVTVPVRPDGKISVPVAGDVVAGGRSAEQVAQAVREKLAQYVREPVVTVIVTGLSSHEFLNRVRVTGAVRQQRSLSHRPSMTVVDVVLDAGGINEFAAPNRTKIFRRGADGKVTVFDVELGDILNKGRLDTNYVLKPGDVVSVPERIF
jgi:polysaccharide export outer membrane protein